MLVYDNVYDVEQYSMYLIVFMSFMIDSYKVSMLGKKKTIFLHFIYGQTNLIYIFVSHNTPIRYGRTGILYINILACCMQVII